MLSFSSWYLLLLSDVVSAKLDNDVFVPPGRGNGSLVRSEWKFLIMTSAETVVRVITSLQYFNLQADHFLTIVTIEQQRLVKHD